MFRTNLLVAWRSIKASPAFSAINISGLALGIACSLLIFLWVRDERNMDRFETNGHPIYRIIEKIYTAGSVDAGPNAPGPLAAELRRVIPGIRYATPFAQGDDKIFQTGDKIIRQNGGYADSDYFSIFPFPLLQGDPSTALNSPLSLAISGKMAISLFGDAAHAIGQTVRYDNKKDLRVTAVFADLPGNVSQPVDFLVNWPTFREENGWAAGWETIGPHTLFTLKAGVTPDNVRALIRHLPDHYIKDPNYRYELDLQPYSDSWLHGEFKNGVASGGRIVYVNLFSLVAVFILLIACINFMNLATARSSRRAKEIGVRKVAGAGRGSLIRQFIGEALLLTLLATLLALAIVSVTLPWFNQLTGKRIGFPFTSPWFWLQLTALTGITGFVAGSYPALFLSSFRAIKVLKGALRSGPRITFIRKGLVVFQFTLSIIFIAAMVIITRQVDYIRHASLGFDRVHLLYIPVEGDLGKNYDLFRQQARDIPGVTGVSRLTESPTGIYFNTAGLDWQGKDPHVSPMFIVAAAGYDFVPTLRLTLAQGRDFSRSFPTDSAGYLVNESAVRLFHYKNPVGMPLSLWGKKGHIVGVLKDFHFNSLHEEIHPLVLALNDHLDFGTLLVRVQTGDMHRTLAGLRDLCRGLNPKFPFNYSFADEVYQRQYKDEEIISGLSDSFAVLAIIISCLGLLGLALFTTEQRAKEIGIRKVLGAGVMSVFGLLSSQFLRLILLAILIATPLAWWTMNTWLRGFAYRIAISWWMFLLTSAIAIGIALLTVGFQAVKAAIANPVKSLRAE